MSDREKIRSFISQLLEKKHDQTKFDDADSLLISGRLDSLDVLEIVVFLEQAYGIDFSERGFDQTEFDTIKSMLNILVTKNRI